MRIANVEHISVCICTYKRPQLLRRLLNELRNQDTDGLFWFSIVVVDNDLSRSAELIVKTFAERSTIPVKYSLEPRQNIARARNMAVANATGDFIAFIDDDEFPAMRWLVTLYEACKKYDVDGVLGPVKPHFEDEPPSWIIDGKFYERKSYPTGLVIDWKKGRTGNVLLKRGLFASEEQPFNPEFLTGEDQEFFGRMIDKGHIFIWCAEAVAYETVLPPRWKRTFMLKRALLSGSISKLHSTFGVSSIARSAVAVPAYALVLPFSILGGHHRFMICLIKLVDHLGGLLALLGVKLIKGPYVTS